VPEVFDVEDGAGRPDDEKAPDDSYAHDLDVQETVLHAGSMSLDV
jgi:hypothetical protein